MTNHCGDDLRQGGTWPKIGLRIGLGKKGVCAAIHRPHISDASWPISDLPIDLEMGGSSKRVI